MKSRLRFYLSDYDADDSTNGLLVHKAISIERQCGNISRIVFLSDDMSNGDWLAKLIGEASLKKLKGYAQWPGSSLAVNFENAKTYRTIDDEILITFNLESDEILLLDDKPHINAIIALAMHQASIEKWTRITNAVNIENSIAAESYADPPCIVMKALETLTESIEMATGLDQSFDDRLAKTYLRALNTFKIHLPGEKIESYLIKHLSWTKGHAIPLIEIIRKINSGEPFEGGSKANHECHIKKWKEDCSQ